MIAPLPGGRADELLRHLRNCADCIGSRVARTTNRCPRYQTLVQLALEERHGDE